MRSIGVRTAGIVAAVVAVAVACPVAPSAAAASVRHHGRGHAHHRHKHRRPREKNPFTPGLRAWLATRSDQAGAAVENLRTGRTFVYHPGFRFQTASIVKVDILETLLHQTQDHGGLTPSEFGIAQGMIENSDNTDATDLWNAVGGASAVAAYDVAAGLNDTTPNFAWGLTETTAPDQIALLRQLVEVGGLLTRASQNYALYLMSHVESDEAWGISGGVPAGVEIAIKNGWLPFGAGWHVNSIGRVKGDGRHYLIAVLTDDNGSEAYGIDTIEHVAGSIWNALAPRRR
jgi:beta-lactamase class A